MEPADSTAEASAEKKRTAAEAGVGNDNEDSNDGNSSMRSATPEPPKKRTRVSNRSMGNVSEDGNNDNGSEDNDLPETLEELFASVMTLTDAADPERLLHLMFRLLPSQKRYPEYYKTISNPLDLKTIGTKIVENKYSSTEELETDLAQMCKNAQIFLMSLDL